MRGLDWKDWNGGWPYKSLDDPKYLKDRLELFRSNGNGWWWFKGKWQEDALRKTDKKLKIN